MFQKGRSRYVKCLIKKRENKHLNGETKPNCLMIAPTEES